MKKPRIGKRIIRGIDVIMPPVRAMLEAPDCSDLQQCTDRELGDASAAVDYLERLATYYESRGDKAAESEG